MSHIGMQKTRCQHPDLLTGTDAPDVKFKLSKKGQVVKSF
jgi:hypothetical protein